MSLESNDDIDFNALDNIITDATNNIAAREYYNKIKNLLDKQKITSYVIIAIQDNKVTFAEILQIIKYVCSVIKTSNELINSFNKDMANDLIRLIVFTSIRDELKKHTLNEDIQNIIEMTTIIDIAIKAIDMGIDFLLENVVYEFTNNKCCVKLFF